MSNRLSPAAVLLISLSVVVLFGLGSCGDGGGTGPEPTLRRPEPASLTIRPERPTATALEQVVELTTTVLSSQGDTLNGSDLSWSVENPDVARPTGDDGSFEALAEGETVIRAEVRDHPDVSDEVTLTVDQRVAEVRVEPSAATLRRGDTLQLTAHPVDVNGHPVPETEAGAWSSENPEVAEVSSTGLVDALGLGLTTIHVVIEEVLGSAEMTVEGSGQAQEPGVYVVNSASDDVSVIDPDTKTVTTTIEVASTPLAADISPDGALVYVTHRSGDIVSVIETATNTVTGTFQVGSVAADIAFTPDGSAAWTVNSDTDVVSVVDVTTESVVSTFPAGSDPTAVAFSPDGTTAYVTNNTADQVSVVDVASLTVVGTIPVGATPMDVAFAPDGTKAYVVNRQDDNVSVIDAGSGTVSGTIPVGDAPRRVAFSPDGSEAYVADRNDGNVSVIDVTQDQAIGTVGTGGGPISVGFTAGPALAWVPNYLDDEVSVIEVSTGTVTTVPVGEAPSDVATWLQTTGQPSVNDPPTFTPGGDVAVLEDAGAVSEPWASNMSPGPPDESGQSLTGFTVTNSDNSLFDDQPAIALDGTLTFTPAPDANGSATVTVTLSDDGGTANGGSDTSAPETFTITIDPVNDAPSFTAGDDVGVFKDSGPYSQGWATDLSAGPVDESGQNLSFAVTANTNSALFSTGPEVAPDGTLSFTPATGTTGTAKVTAELSDDGGTADGGEDTSAPVTFTIRVQAAVAYVTNQSDNTVSVLDLASGTEVATIPVGDSPHGVAFTPDGTRAYVTTFGDDDVSTIDVGSASVLGTTAVGSTPLSVAVNPDGSFAYVANLDSDHVSVIDVASGAVTKSIGLLAGSGGRDIAFTPDGGTAYVVAQYRNEVAVIDVGSATLSKTIGVGRVPQAVAISPDGAIAYVANVQDSDVSVIDVSTGTVTGTIPVGSSPRDLAFAPDGSTAFVANTNAQSVSRIDVSSGTVSATISVGWSPYSVAFAADGSTAYVVNLGGDNVSVVDVGTNTVTGTIGVGDLPRKIAVLGAPPDSPALNDPPTFTSGGDVAVLEDAGAVSQPWATNLSPGPADESGQSLTGFTVTNSDNSLFDDQPAIALDGTLTFTPAPDANGSATVTVTLSDDGGTPNGGDDTSAPETFTITVDAVNDAPSFTAGDDVDVLKDSGPYSQGWATALSVGPANEAGQSLTFAVTGNTNPGLLASGPSLAPDGTLSFTPAAGATGLADVTVELSDDGGTANGGRIRRGRRRSRSRSRGRSPTWSTARMCR